MPRKKATTSKSVDLPEEGSAMEIANPDRTGEITIRDLLSYRIHYTANAMSRSAMIRFRDDFGVNLGEWRTIALLGADPGMSLNELAKQANLDKGQMSRIVSSLSGAGYIERDETIHTGRTIALSLTRRGQTLYKQLIATARQREEAFMACLSEDEKTHLFSALGKLNILAKAMYSPSLKTLARKTSKPRSEIRKASGKTELT